MCSMTSKKIPIDEDEQTIEYLDGINTFGDYLDFLMEDLDVAQVDLASYLGLTQTAVSKWIKGERIPKPDHLYKICESLNLPEVRQASLLRAYLKTRNCKTVAEFGKAALEARNKRSLSFVEDYSLSFDDQKQGSNVLHVATPDNGGQK